MDDLTKLKGVGAATAAMLAGAGITSLAALAAADVAHLTEAGKFKAIHDVAGWIEQARILTGAASSPAPAWRGAPVSVVLRKDVEGVGIAGETVTLPYDDAADLRHAGKARRMLLSDLSAS